MLKNEETNHKLTEYICYVFKNDQELMVLSLEGNELIKQYNIERFDLSAKNLVV